jgi:hypothetical protein
LHKIIIFPTAQLAHKYACIYACIYASGIQALILNSVMMVEFALVTSWTYLYSVMMMVLPVQLLTNGVLGYLKKENMQG